MLNLKKPTSREMQSHYKQLNTAENQPYTSHTASRVLTAQATPDPVSHTAWTNAANLEEKPSVADLAMEATKKQLINMIQNLPEGSLRSKLQKKLYLLEIAEFQDKQRREVISQDSTILKASEQIPHGMMEAGLIDRQFYIRVSSFNYSRSKHDAKVVGKVEQALRTGQESKKRTKHSEMVTEFMDAHREFFEFHRKKYVKYS